MGMSDTFIIQKKLKNLCNKTILNNNNFIKAKVLEIPM